MAKKQFFQESELVFGEKSHHLRFNNLQSRRFGRLTVLGVHQQHKTGFYKWFCKCDCGNIVSVASSKLSNGHTQSCGCYKISRIKECNTTHGHTANGKPSKTYSCWQNMGERCKNVTNIGYDNYGGRGIRVCERWEDYENFLLDMGEAPIGFSIDRKDVNGNYEPTNCKWSDIIEQANNRRSNRILEVGGEKITLAEFARKNDIDQDIVWTRLSLGWDVDKILKHGKADVRSKLISHNGEARNIKEWAEMYGIPYGTLRSRINKLGWPFEKAISAPVEIHRKTRR